MNKLYFYIRVLSIDIVVGAMSVSLYASHIFKSQIPQIYWLLLPFTVWLIYTFDHITDGLKVMPPLQKPSYKFHYTNKSILIPILIILSATITILFFAFFHSSLLFVALLGGGWTGIYFVVYKIFPANVRNWFPKEILISIGYIIGTFGVPFLTKSKTIGRAEILIITSFFLLVLTNVLIYSYFDFEEDKQIGFSGIIQVLGIKSGFKTTASLIIICMALSLYLMFSKVTSASTIFIMALVMLVIIFKPILFSKNKLYGKVADTLFLLPGFIVLFL